MIVRVLVYSVLLAGSLCGDLLFGQGPLAITGTVVTSGGVVENGTILVKDGKIAEVGANVTIPKDVPVLKVDGVVFPGLIDLHNHLVWNVLPRWRLPAPVGTRYDWQAMPEYAKRLTIPEGALISKGFGCDMERYAEVKALLGGATTVTGSFGPTDADPMRNECVKGLARNLDVFSGLYSDKLNAEPVRYEVFPFEISWQQAQAIREGLGSRQLKAVIFHVGEGKDASASREFRMLRARGFMRPGVIVIHGVSLREPEFREMAANGVGWVWSPRSNIELYAQTADVAAATAAHVTMALAPDWSPTGSSGILDELRYAWAWDGKHKRRLLSESDFFQMVTINPAILAGVSDKIGSIASGMMADLIVLPRGKGDPLQALVNAEPASAELVFVGGKPLLGRPDYMKQLLPDKQLESVRVCGREIAFNILEDTQGQSFAAIEERLKTAMQALGTSLAGLSECEQ